MKKFLLGFLLSGIATAYWIRFMLPPLINEQLKITKSCLIPMKYYSKEEGGIVHTTFNPFGDCGRKAGEELETFFLRLEK